MALIVVAGGGFGIARYLGLIGSPKASPTEVVTPSPAVVAPALPVAPVKPAAVEAKAPAKPAAPPALAKEPPPAPPAPSAPPEEPKAAEKAPGAALAEKPAKRSRAARERDVFKESAKRVRSLSQGIDQFPPGTIQLTPAPSDTP